MRIFEHLILRALDNITAAGLTSNEYFVFIYLAKIHSGQSIIHTFIGLKFPEDIFVRTKNPHCCCSFLTSKKIKTMKRVHLT